MNRHQTRALEDFLDGPRSRYYRRQRAIARREALGDVFGALAWLLLLFVIFVALS